MQQSKRQTQINRMNQRQLYQMKKTRENEKQQIFKAIQRSKQDDARHAKLLRRDMELKRREYLDRLRGQNQFKTKIIKDQQRYAALRLEERKKKRLQEFTSQYQNRIDNQDKIKQQKELEVQYMEKMEMELIKKLQNTQAIQKSAYADFQNALALPTKSKNVKQVK